MGVKQHPAITRRQFLQAGTVTGAALTLTGAALAADPNLKPVRFGVIGTGGRGTALLRNLLSVPGVEVHAVCDVVRERAEAAQRLVGQKAGRPAEVYAGDENVWTQLAARADLDAVLIATPWEWHARMAVAAMRAGHYAAVEVPAALTLEECWELVRVSEETGRPCMMLENVCYFQNVLTLLRMVREGVLGEVLHSEGGYQHDGRAAMFDAQGDLTWRGRHIAAKNGNQYPTHPLGPIAQWMNINRGDRFTQLLSMSTPAKGVRELALKKFGPDHAATRREYAQGDVNTTLLQTAQGRTVTLYFDILTPRPYDLIFRLQGTKGLYHGTLNQIALEGPGVSSDKWQPFEPYLEKFEHPLWKALAAVAKDSGHGGADYITLHEFVQAVRDRRPTPQDVYDAATWSAVVPLSIASVAKGSQPLEFPDFTRGKWKTTPPRAA